jgi:hypothetical protein
VNCVILCEGGTQKCEGRVGAACVKEVTKFQVRLKEVVLHGILYDTREDQVFMRRLPTSAEIWLSRVIDTLTYIIFDLRFLLKGTCISH